LLFLKTGSYGSDFTERNATPKMSITTLTLRVEDAKHPNVWEKKMAWVVHRRLMPVILASQD
jgi:hypothetical protein